MTTSSSRWSSISLTRVSIASPPKSSPASAYASSMKSAPPSALRDHLGGLDRGLADVAGDELGAVALDEVTLRQHADRPVDARDEARDGGLARAGVADEHEMAREVGVLQAGRDPQPLDAQHLGLVAHLGLHRRRGRRARRARRAAPRASSAAASVGVARARRSRRARSSAVAGSGGRRAPGDAVRRTAPAMPADASRDSTPTALASCALPDTRGGGRAPRSSARRATRPPIASSASAARVRARRPRVRAEPAERRTGVGAVQRSREPVSTAPANAAAGRPKAAAHARGGARRVAADDRGRERRGLVAAPRSGAPPSRCSSSASSAAARSSGATIGPFSASRDRARARRSRTSRRGSDRARSARRRRPGTRRRRGRPSSSRAGRAGRTAP